MLYEVITEDITNQPPNENILRNDLNEKSRNGIGLRPIHSNNENNNLFITV